MKTKPGRCEIPRHPLFNALMISQIFSSVWQWFLSNYLRKQGSHGHTVLLSSSSSLPSFPLGVRGMGNLQRETKGNTTGEGGPKDHPISDCHSEDTWNTENMVTTVTASGPRDNICQKNKRGIFWFEGLLALNPQTPLKNG